MVEFEHRLWCGDLPFCLFFYSSVLVSKFQYASEFLFRIIHSEAYKLYFMAELTPFPRQFCQYKIFILELLFPYYPKDGSCLYFFISTFIPAQGYSLGELVDMLLNRCHRIREKLSSNI